MSAIDNRIEEIKKNGYTLNFSESFDNGFKLWQNLFAYGALAYLIFFGFSWLLNLITQMLPFMQDATSQLEAATQGNSQDYAALQNALEQYYSNPEVMGTALFIQLLLSLMFPIIAGIVYMAYRFEKDGTSSVSYLFEGFNGKRMGNLMVLYFIYRICSFIGLVLFGVGFFLPFVGFTIASCFVLFNDMSAFSAIKASFTVCYKKFFMVLIIMLLSWLFGAIGVFGCLIGALFTMPLVPIMCYVIYKNSVGVDITTDIDAIGNIENS